MKKSQMELFGLAIVVVIIIMATIFVLIFSFNKAPSEGRKAFIESEQASALINTLLKVNVDDATSGCRGILMSDLIRICAQNPDSTCGGTQKSCLIAESVANTILASTIDVWTNHNYYFTVHKIGDDPDEYLMESGTPCQGDKKFKQYTIPGPVTVQVNLDICG